MTFLYGDSTICNLEINYIAFLSEALDLAIAVLVADARARNAVQQKERRRLGSEDELTSLKSLAANLNRLLTVGDQLPSASTREAAARIRHVVQSSMQEAAGSIRQHLHSEIGELEMEGAREREAILKALEKFLMKNDLPETSFRYLIKLNQHGTRAELSGHAECKVDWVMVLEVDALFSHPLRVDRVAEGLEIEMPELSGMVRKTMKLKPYKLSNKVVTELSWNSREGHVKLRASADDTTAEGLDIAVGPAQKVRVARVGGNSQSEPFEPSKEDSARLRELFRTLCEVAQTSAKRRSLVSATLDGKSFADHDDPTALCQRLVTKMAPTVCEIANRSLSQDELVLKRVVGDHRREEIFLPKSELRKKIAQAPEETRGVFVPLGLGEKVTTRQPAAVIEEEVSDTSIFVEPQEVTRVDQVPAPRRVRSLGTRAPEPAR